MRVITSIYSTYGPLPKVGSFVLFQFRGGGYDWDVIIVNIGVLYRVQRYDIYLYLYLTPRK